MLRYFLYIKSLMFDWRSWLLACVFSISIIWFFQSIKPSPYQTDLSSIASQSDHIQKDLTAVTKQFQVSHSLTSQKIDAIERRFLGIEQSMKMLTTQTDITQLKILIEEKNQNIMNQLRDLQHGTKPMKRQAAVPDIYLSPKVLPFKILTVDIWNGEPQVTIMVKGKVTLMGKQDTYLGWTLKNISFNPALAVFSNAREQRVKVVL